MNTHKSNPAGNPADISTSTSVANFDQARLMRLLEQVTDPEIPVLSIAEMGILRGVEMRGDTVMVIITPTYSGCPAMQQITDDVQALLAEHGYPKADVELVLSPAWTTDWMSEQAKEKLLNYGIAPPCKSNALNDISNLNSDTVLQFSATCPQCRSTDTQCVSQFGSTACKALWKCNACLEPFDYFKPI